MVEGNTKEYDDSKETEDKTVTGEKGENNRRNECQKIKKEKMI